MDHPLATTTLDLAPSSSTAPVTSKSAIFLELHLGAVVGAIAGVIGDGVEEIRDGGLRPETKCRSAEFLCELVRLREYMIVNFPDFDDLARRRGIEVLVACNTPPETANFLVDSALELLTKLVHQQAN